MIFHGIDFVGHFDVACQFNLSTVLADCREIFQVSKVIQERMVTEACLFILLMGLRKGVVVDFYGITVDFNVRGGSVVIGDPVQSHHSGDFEGTGEDGGV